MTASPTPRIPGAPRDGDMIIGPDHVRVFHHGWVECGFDGCDWYMVGDATSDHMAQLREHTASVHAAGGRP